VETANIRDNNLTVINEQNGSTTAK